MPKEIYRQDEKHKGVCACLCNVYEAEKIHSELEMGYVLCALGEGGGLSCV